jgi:phage repressor protein C with HTH and peptisase S24 domain
MLLVDDSVPENADFAVVIQGSSMEPYIFDGDTVFVKKQYELGVGDVGIFSVDGAMYCKIFYIDDKGNLTLVSANPELKESNVRVNADSDTNVVCCGKVLLPEHVPFPAYFEV